MKISTHKYYSLLNLTFIFGFFFCQNSMATPLTQSADIIIYGATPSGIIAAVQASRLGKSVILLEASQWIGGMVAGGLSSTDVGFTHVISGTTQEYFNRTNKIERETNANPVNPWMVEPHVARKVFKEMLEDAKVSLQLNEPLLSVHKTGTQITLVETIHGSHFTAPVFIDASYEGDLMAKAGISFTWGRESVSTYNEEDAGVQEPEKVFNGRIDPYERMGDPTSPLLFSVTQGPARPKGSADKHIMAYNYRHCATTNLANAISYRDLAPADYDPYLFSGAKRIIDTLSSQRPAPSGEAIARIFFNPGKKSETGKLEPYANHKFDINGGSALSTDVVYWPDLYVNGNEKTREKVRKQIANYNQGLFHFLASDERIPQSVRDYMSEFGSCKDEFETNNYLPTQMYIREARRMKGRYIMTEHNVLLKTSVEDPIALSGYNIDTHNHQLLNIDGALYREGHQNAKGYDNSMIDFCTPYGISYASLTPQSSQATNLLVSVAISASAVANGSLRLEPQYMMMGQAAGTAAVLAINNQTSVQEISYSQLRQQLLADKQRLDTINDFLLMKVCVDPRSNSILYGKSPLDPSCTTLRQIRPGERLPYVLSPANGPQQSECSSSNKNVLIEAHANTPLVRESVNRYLSTTFLNYNACESDNNSQTAKRFLVHGANKEFAFQMGEWRSNNSALGVVGGGISPQCTQTQNGNTTERHNSRRYYEYYNISPTVIPALGEGSFRRFLSLSQDKALSSLDSPCPTKYEPTLTLWAHEEFSYGADQSPQLQKLESIISDHYIGHSSPELGQIMERSYFAKNFGLLRTESWRRSDWSQNSESAQSLAKKLYASKACRIPFKQKDTPTLSFGNIHNEEESFVQEISDSTLGKHNWYLISCQDLSSIVISKNPLGDTPPSFSQLPEGGTKASPFARFIDFWAK